MTAPLPDDDGYATLHRRFGWKVPTRFNLAEVCCTRWARRCPDAVAIRVEQPDGQVRLHSFAQLSEQANRLAHVLRRHGVQRGDRVAVVLPQRFETAVTYIALARLGAVAMPLSMLFGPDALEYRINDSQAAVAVVDATAMVALHAVRPQCPGLRTVVTVGDDADAAARGDVDWQTALAAEKPRFATQATQADDAAVLIYTSGTTGPPKGALIPHRALIGNLSGFVCSQNWLRSGRQRQPRRRLGPGGVPADAVFWSPADWAWTGGLMDALLPCLYFAVPIVAYPGRFEPLRAFELLQKHRVTNSFLFPTALKAMMKAVPHPGASYRLRLRSLMSAGEALGDTVFHWCREALGVVPNEMFGQTEINYIVGNCSQTEGCDGHPPAHGKALGWPARPGSMGRAYPGHRVAVIDEHGNECPPGTPGEVAVHRLDRHGLPDPVFFLGYWRRDDATRAKYSGDPTNSWCRTGDTATMDADGYLWYLGRADDMFKAAGYRIGPGEVENCLLRHPAVANAAVVPKPDPERGAVVKAYVVLAPGQVGDAALVTALQAHVRGQLAPYEYPKEIEFIAALPMTTTGKVRRMVLRQQEIDRAAAQPHPPPP